MTHTNTHTSDVRAARCAVVLAVVALGLSLIVMCIIKDQQDVCEAIGEVYHITTRYITATARCETLFSGHWIPIELYLQMGMGAP
jgi:hypothetical protein